MRDELAPPDYSRGAPIPWWAKVGLKIVLSRLPIPYGTWSRLGAFRHSFVTDSGKVLHEVQAHVQRYVDVRGRPPECVLELGPGELTTRAVTYAALGVKKTILVDVGDFGTMDVATYQHAARAAGQAGLQAPDLEGVADRAEVFSRCGTHYLCEGRRSLEALAQGEVDLIVSDAVIEHVRLHDLRPLLAALRRVGAPDCFSRHGIDFHDHLGGGLENLRFSQALWESEWMAGSGFYTNRVSASAMLGLLEHEGFRTVITYRLLRASESIARKHISTDLAAG